MNYRHLRYPGGWEWHVLLPSPGSPDDAEMRKELPELFAWVESALERQTNHIAISEHVEGVTALHGTLMMQVQGNRQETAPLHFWSDRNRLVMIPPDASLPARLQLPPWQFKLERCANAPEALLVVLQALLDRFHEGLDRFEQRLSLLETSMQSRNRADLLDEIFERRYELLHWNHLFIPIREIEGAAREAFLAALSDTETAMRLQHRLVRIEALLQHYSAEIDTLISMDDAIASFRGNDIMKTLTIFTALFTPATVAGALWGMNFRRIPWSAEPAGFLLVCAVVTGFTLLIYLWLWRKGWTGDLLLSHKRQRNRSHRLPLPELPDPSGTPVRSRRSRGQERVIKETPSPERDGEDRQIRESRASRHRKPK
ncbi:CorA family divalent cation transporter [Paenibacillus daejeonensis]|uniref:CorA family divalent cation transporter n=1 Tax=Paenibacillus daejeonensis TaxID=135193 RepID=UPI0003788271|nr:CorA family divalent cation transporter [Paenibacillus daejeonensis]